jgi:hypothetical protein
MEASAIERKALGDRLKWEGVHHMEASRIGRKALGGNCRTW